MRIAKIKGHYRNGKFVGPHLRRMRNIKKLRQQEYNLIEEEMENEL